MRAAGLDLAVIAPSKVVVDRETEGPTEWKVPSSLGGLAALVGRLVRAGIEAVVVESTAMAWFIVGVAVARQGEALRCFRVSGTKTAALRRFFSLFTQTDRTDAQALRLMAEVDPHLEPLRLPRAGTLALRRLVGLRHKRTRELSREKNRLLSLGHWALRGIPEAFGGKVTEGLLSVLERWPTPASLARARPQTIARVGRCSRARAERVREAARELAAFYEGYLDWEGIGAEVASHLQTIRHLQGEVARLDREIARRHRADHPEDPLFTVPGVGPVVAAVIRGVVGEISRFRNLVSFRGFTGLTPRRKASGTKDHSGRISKAGPAVLRWALYLAAETARQWDPALAELYWRLRMRGHHHTSATVAVASHLVGRIWAVMREGRPYVYRDLEGNPISREEARAIVLSLRPDPSLVPEPAKKGGPPSTSLGEESSEARPSIDQLIEELVHAAREGG